MPPLLLMRRLSYSSFLSRFGGVDWGMLIGMLAVTQNRFFAVKLMGVGLLAFATPALKWLLRPGFQRFYLAMAAWAVVEWAFIVRDYSQAYSIVVGYAVGYWVLMAVVAAALRGTVEESPPEKKPKTLDTAFGIVALLSLVTLVSTAARAGVINPFEGATEPLFGMSSGDHVTGLFGFHLFRVRLGDYSAVNGAVLALFAVFFVGEARWRHAALAFVLMLFTTSNFLTLVTLAATGVLAIGRWQRKYLLASLAGAGLTLLFYTVVTPKNLRYLTAELSDKAAQVVPQRAGQRRSAPRLNHRPVIEQATAAQKREAGFNPDEESGKLRAFRQTGALLGESARHLLAGAGPGRFSSGLALLAATPSSGKGRLHEPLDFQSDEFRRGHGRISDAVKRMHPRYHTISQMPTSWYNQVAGEYGLVGVILFLGLYIGGCLRSRRGAVGAALVFALLCILVSDYIFEGLSVVPFFEWMLWSSRPKGRDAKAIHQPASSVAA